MWHRLPASGKWHRLPARGFFRHMPAITAVELHYPGSMDPRQIRRQSNAPRQGIANTAAERVDHVFFRMAVGREVNPLAAPALPAVVSERVSQAHAPGVDCQVAGFQKQLEGIEPVQDQMLRPPGEDSRAEHPLVFGVGGRAQ